LPWCREYGAWIEVCLSKERPLVGSQPRDTGRIKRAAALLLFGVCACDGADVPAGGGADLPTTESSPPYAEWALDSAPSIRIGAEGAPEYQFSRIGYAARLSDGRLVVYDGASAELRWFDPEGAFLFRAGGRGEGPGEFLSVASATVTSNDSVVLYDFKNQRLTWFGPEGSLSRTLRLELHPMAVTLVPFGDSRLVISEERPAFNIGGQEYNYVRDSVLVVVADDNAEALDTLMHRPGREAATWVEYTDGQPTGTRQFGLPFGHPTLLGATSDVIVMVEDSRPELAFFNEEGEPVRLARRTDLDPRPLSTDLRQEYLSHAIRRARERGFPEQPAAEGAEGLLEVIPEEKLVAPFDRMLTDPVSERLWLRDYVFEWNVGEAQHWTVHDTAGQVLGRVRTPPGLEVMQVAPNHVVGVERDEMGVEYVVAYRFRDSN